MKNLEETETMMKQKKYTYPQKTQKNGAEEIIEIIQVIQESDRGNT